MDKLKLIAFTHKNYPGEELGKLHIEDTEAQEKLTQLKVSLQLDELLFISTCNRVEFLFSTEEELTASFVKKFISTFYENLDAHTQAKLSKLALCLENEDALRHLFSVASSLDSLVVGEREIITQVRSAYEQCKKMGLTGDSIRLVVQKTIENAKEVYTKTNIARNPVSVVSLAYRKLRELNCKLDSRILIIGSGVTNTAMAQYLKKHGFKNFTVYNRTLANAENLATDLSGKAFALSDLKNHTTGFDVLVVCTGATQAIITPELYTTLVANETGKKVIVDLAMPHNVEDAVVKAFPTNYISIAELKDIAEKNLQERVSELKSCEQIIENNIAAFKEGYRARRVERAMGFVPQKVKEIKETALNEVFAKDIEQLDEKSKETLDKVLNYFEKKYISVPMKMAREIILEEIQANK
ncbi:MAG: glutamyl-tRNA reductase [Bacteroidetes bacterium]|nr:glutamyl-tRNA reductase [Bacteroidota bacterium]